MVTNNTLQTNNEYGLMLGESRTLMIFQQEMDQEPPKINSNVQMPFDRFLNVAVKWILREISDKICMDTIFHTRVVCSFINFI